MVVSLIVPTVLFRMINKLQMKRFGDNKHYINQKVLRVDFRLRCGNEWGFEDPLKGRLSVMQ